MTRTFLDSGVLIAAARGTDELHLRALDILDDPEREFITSDYVRLEVIPNAVFHRKEAERKFYEAFFDHAVATVHPLTGTRPHRRTRGIEGLSLRYGRSSRRGRDGGRRPGTHHARKTYEAVLSRNGHRGNLASAMMAHTPPGDT